LSSLSLGPRVGVAVLPGYAPRPAGRKLRRADIVAATRLDVEELLGDAADRA
jgi:hypothetical protein